MMHVCSGWLGLSLGTPAGKKTQALPMLVPGLSSADRTRVNCPGCSFLSILGFALSVLFRYVTVWEDSATISKAMPASTRAPFKRAELLDKFYIKTRHTQSIIFVWCKVSWKYIKLTVRECLAWLPRSSAFHYLFNYNQIERLLKKKKKKSPWY